MGITFIVTALILRQKCCVFQVLDWKIQDIQAKNRPPNKIIFSNHNETKTEFKFKSKVMSINSYSKDINSSFVNCQTEHVKRFSSSSKHKIFSLANSSKKRFSGSASNNKEEEEVKENSNLNSKIESTKRIDSCFTFNQEKNLIIDQEEPKKRIEIQINVNKESNK